MILYVYILISAAVTALYGTVGGMFSMPYAWWATPLMLVLITLALILLHCAVFALMIFTVRLDKPARDTRFFRMVADGFLHMAFKLARIDVHLTGIDKIPEDERFLLVCNHIHDFDPAIILYAAPKAKLAFIAKREVRDLYPFVYKALHKMHGLPIDREHDREAAKTIINAVKLIRNDENSVAVFPEGYVSKSGELLPIRAGSLKIATKNGCKIVVCTLKGTKEIVKNMFRRHHDVYFDVLEVVDTAGISQTAELSEHIHTTMLNNLKKD